MDEILKNLEMRFEQKLIEFIASRIMEINAP